VRSAVRCGCVRVMWLQQVTIRLYLLRSDRFGTGHRLGIQNARRLRAEYYRSQIITQQTQKLAKNLSLSLHKGRTRNLSVLRRCCSHLPNHSCRTVHKAPRNLSVCCRCFAAAIAMPRLIVLSARQRALACVYTARMEDAAHTP